MKIASFSLGEVLQTSGDAEVSDGLYGGVQEKVKRGLFRTVNDYGIQNIMWSDIVEQDGRFLNSHERIGSRLSSHDGSRGRV